MYDKVLSKFNSDIAESLRIEVPSGRLRKDSRYRAKLRGEVLKLLGTVGLEATDQVRLLMEMGRAFDSFGECVLAAECMDMLVSRCGCIKDHEEAIQTEVEATLLAVRCESALITANDNYQLAPMAVGKILAQLQRICGCLDLLMSLTIKQQEANAWMVLNCCKLLYEIGNPLIFISCGKYIIEMFIFATLCMGSVINLCTIRHLKFRNKLFSSALLAALSLDTTDMALIILVQAETATKELRKREEIELPIPAASKRALEESECDLLLLRQLLSFWKDPDAANPLAGNTPEIVSKSKYAQMCFHEYTRIQQLTTNNINESWRKRGRALLKLFVAFIEGPNADFENISPRCLYDILSSVLFDVNAEPDLVKKVRDAAVKKLESVGMAAKSVDFATADVSNEGTQLHMLVEMLAVMDLPLTSSENILKLRAYLDKLTTISFTDEIWKRRNFLQRAAIGIWNRNIYPAVTKVLYSPREDSFKQSYEALAEVLMATSSLLQTTMAHDPVFTGTVAVVSATFLRECQMYRDGISFSLRALEYIDECRAARTDLRLQYPEDTRDILALQNESFSMRSDYKNWFHSFKRLGAHAFAGFGIFGSSSKMFRGDVALAEIHADLLQAYFRLEILYSGVRRSGGSGDGQEATVSPSRGSPDRTSAMESRAKSRGGTARPGTRKGLSQDLVANISSSSVAKQLRNYCKKNMYARCLLLVELCRVEALGDEKAKLFAEAIRCVEIAEASEADMKRAFADLTVLTDSEFQHPIILSRSHRFFYVVPVGCRALKHVAYYRILARNEGAGTDLAITSDDIVGCDVRVPAKALSYPSADVAVRIDVGVAGDRYVFATGAFKADGSPLGSKAISATSMAIEAVNPLSVIYLWGQIAELAALENATYPFARKAAAAICERYFLVVPRPDILALGKSGLNIFACEEPAISALVIQQSSEVQLATLVKAVILQQIGIDRSLRSRPVHGALRKDDQIELINVVRRLAIAAIIASYIKSQDLITQACLLGYNILSQLIRDDDIALAPYVESPINIFVSALNQIPKKNWNDVEHTLACRLLVDAVSCAVIDKNTESFALLADTAHSDNLVAMATSNANLTAVYQALVGVLFSGNMFLLTSDAKTALLSVLKTVSSTPPVGFWSLSKLQRDQILRGLSDACIQLRAASLPAAGGAAGGKGGAKPAAAPLAKKPAGAAPTATAGDGAMGAEQIVKAWFEKAPDNASDMMDAILFWMRELVAMQQRSRISELLKGFPLIYDYMAPAVKIACDEWGLVFVDRSPPPPTEAEAAAAAAVPAKAAPPAKGKAPEPAPVVVEEPKVVPPKEFTEEEVQAQLKVLGEICFLMADNVLNDEGTSSAPIELRNGKRNFYPQTLVGPIGDLDTHDAEHSLATKDTEAVDPSNTEPSQLLSIRYISASMELLCRAKCPNSVIDIACRLWNLIIDGWTHPKAFASSCLAAVKPPIAFPGTDGQLTDPKPLEMSLDIRLCIQHAASSLVEVLEKTSKVFEDDSLGTMTGEFNFRRDNSAEHELRLRSPHYVCSEREAIQYLYSVRGIALYLIKILWLFKDWKHLVEVGSKLVHVYIQKAPPDIFRGILDSLFGIVIHGQTQILNEALAARNAEQARLDQFVGDWHDAQAKKRKKKARIARGKDPEEEEFERDCAKIQEVVDRASSLMNNEQLKVDTLKSEERRINSSQPVGMQLLVKVRKRFQEFMVMFLAALKPEESRFLTDMKLNDPVAGLIDSPEVYRNAEMFSACVNGDPALLKEFDEIIKDYQDATSFFRDKKDVLGILEAESELGDVLMLFGRPSQAKREWLDAMDGMFYSIEAVKNWRTLVSSLYSSKALSIFALGSVPAAIVLSKLSKFCASNDWDTKSEYCRMAANLCLLMFVDSVGHPQTLSGFAAYECNDILGLGFFACTKERFSLGAFTAALDEILSVLLAEEEYLLCLPLICTLEYIHSSYTMRADHWLKTRLLRIRVLISLKYFSQAASMFAGIRYGISTISSRKRDRPMDEFVDYRGKDLKDKSRSDFDMRENLMDFYGLSPYWNHLAPFSDENKLALKWIVDLPESLNDVLSSPLLEVQIPLSEEQKRAMLEEAAQKAAAEAEAASKDKKGAKPAAAKPGAPAAEAAPAPKDYVTARLISKRIVNAITIECCNFVLKVLSCESNLCSPSRDYVMSQVTVVEARASAVLEAIISEASGANAEKCWCDPYWLLLLYRCVRSLKLCLGDFKKDFVASRAIVTFLQKGLQENMQRMQQTSSIPNSALNEATNIRLALILELADIAERQARFESAIRVINIGAHEAAQICWGHWMRKYLTRRSKIHSKLGNVADSEKDIDSALNSFLYDFAAMEPSKRTTAKSYLTLGLVDAILAKAAVLRSKAMSAPKTLSLKLATQCISLVIQACDLAADLSRNVGFLGSDSNTSIVDKGSGFGCVLNHHLLPPVLHSIVSIHPNDPLLTIETAGSGTDATKKYHELRQAAIDHYGKGVSLGFMHRPDLRLGTIHPADKNVHLGYSKSEFANIYLDEVRVYAVCIASLGNLVFDFQAAWRSAVSSASSLQLCFVSDAARKNYLLENGHGDSDESGESKEFVLGSTTLEMKVKLLTEEGLKLLRHIVSPPTLLRANLLFNAGRFRAVPSAQLLLSGEVGARDQDGLGGMTLQLSQTSLNSPVKGALAAEGRDRLKPDLIPGTPADVIDTSKSAKLCMEPLLAALEVCAKDPICPWELMRSVCIEIVELYGSDRMSWAHSDTESDPTRRLVLAAAYLSLAIKVNNAMRAVTDSPIILSSDKSFSAACPDDVSKLLNSIISTSTTISKAQSGAPTPVPTTAAPPAKSAKPGATDAAAASTPGKPTGRDALFALSALLREADIIRVDGYEYEYAADIHNALSKLATAYVDTCCFKTLPSSSISDFNAPASSFSCLWTLRGLSQNKPVPNSLTSKQSKKIDTDAKDSGLFDIFLGYFLVGAAAGAARNQPLLTKIEVPFSTLIDLERDFTGLKTTWVAENPVTSSSETYAEAVRNIFVRAYLALHFNGSSADIDVSTVYDGGKLKLTIKRRSGEKSCVLEISDTVLGSCAKVFANRVSALSCVDNAVCGFLWFCMS